jgi:hypothetical protein
MTAATAAEVKTIRTGYSFKAMTLLTAVLGHIAKPLEKCTMDPPQFTTATAAFFHKLVIPQFAHSAQSGENRTTARYTSYNPYD